MGLKNNVIANGDIVKITANDVVALLPNFNQVRIYNPDDAVKLARELSELADRIKIQAHRAKTTEILSKPEKAA